jgi:hypothetical protein
MRAVMLAIETLAGLYRVCGEAPELRDDFIELLNRMFKEGLGTAYGVEGFTQYQKDALREILFGEEETFVLLWSRQVGKTTMMGVFALIFAFVHYPEPAEILVVGPSFRYSGRLFDKVDNALQIFAKYYDALAKTRTGYVSELVKSKSRTRIVFSWGANISCLPAKNIRGASPNLILIDEAAFMPEASWQEILPMLKAKRKGKRVLVLTSTPFGTTGRFYEFWMRSKQGYPFHITYKDCPFADVEGIERELKEGLLTESEWKREYLAEFIPGEGQAIPDYLINRAIEDYEYLEDGDLGV